MKKQIITLACLMAGVMQTMADNRWLQAFSNPPAEAKPWTFWYWMFGCVSDEGIRLDLEAMHRAGIEGFYLMPIKDTTEVAKRPDMPMGSMPLSRQLSGEWFKRLDTVYGIADSLSLQMGIHFSDGFALGGGPWIKPEESMQRVVWSDTIVSGGRIKNIVLPQPKAYEGYYEDIALYAYPARWADSRKPKASVEFPYRSKEPCDIIMQYDSPFTLRSVRIVTGGNNIQAHRFKIYASMDGTNYSFVREIAPARQGWQNTDAQATYAVPATLGRYFKFSWAPEGSNPGSEDMDAAKWKPNLKVGGIELGSEPVVDGYEGKSGMVWRVPVPYTNSQADCVPADEMICLTGHASTGQQGMTLSTTLPKGRWHILRMGHTSTGHTNATGGGGKGLECDKFSPKAVGKQFDHWFRRIYEHAPKDVAERVLKRFHLDSWECGSQNWSSGFAREFERRRGYSLMPWLPLYAGVPMASGEESNRVLRDVRLTIAELIDEVFFNEIRRRSKAMGVSFSAECVAPTMVSDGLLHYRHVDYPMGEFWLDSPTHDKLNDMIDAISGAHIYGKNIIQAEGFTEIRGTWHEHPGMIKPLLDRNYCLGTNAIVFHVNTHNPWTNRRPGMTLDGIGTFFQRDNTWWRHMPAFTQYIARCQALLQYGRPVIDMAVYTGDEVPRRSILPERLVPVLPGLYGKETVEREARRLANVGQPLEVSPVGVTHTANMTKAEQWVNPLRGYKYDSFNHDVLNTSKVVNGRLVTNGGMEYGVLVVPGKRPMNPEGINTAQSQIDNLKAQGLKVIEQVWTDSDLSALGIERDAVLPTGIDYTHRHGKDADIYFLSNQTDSTVTFTPNFRAARAHRYMADPMTGNIYLYAEGGEITLTQGASIFVVMADEAVKPTAASDNLTYNMLKAMSSSDMLASTGMNDLEWDIRFETTGKTITTNNLKSWSEWEDPAMKYYSGSATYTTSFTEKGRTKNARYILNLGQVANIAEVSVNGMPCGTLWTDPYIVDITPAVRRGTNTLTITVTNTWANALLGNDLGTPPFSGIWTNGKYRLADKRPLKAGLPGNGRIVKVKGKR